MQNRNFLGWSSLLLFLWAIGGSIQAQPQEEARDFMAQGRKIVEELALEHFEDVVAQFDPTVKKALPLEKLTATWKGVVGQVGPFKRQLSAREEKSPPYTVILVTCEFAQTLLDFKVVFNSEGQISGFWLFPSKAYQAPTPAYAKENSFREREVTVGSGEWALPGTLTVPMGDGPFPAVVLVHGSGPQDRDETIGPNKPFRDLALGLASQGIAVLRYEKRTKVHAAQMVAIREQLTVREETVEDALLAVALLGQTPEIDARRIFVLGHSLGGTLLPRIETACPTITGTIALAGACRPLEDLILEQCTYLASLQGELSEAEKEQLQLIQKQVTRVKDPSLSSAVSPTELPFGVPAAYWLDLRGYDPAKLAQELKRPMLILQGERDYQVTLVDFGRWKEALASRSEVQYKSYAKLNHLFMEGEGPGKATEYLKAGNVAGEVIDDIAQWILKMPK